VSDPSCVLIATHCGNNDKHNTNKKKEMGKKIDSFDDVNPSGWGDQ